MIWKLLELPGREIAQTLAEQLSENHPFPLSIAEILVRRKILTYEQARAFFVPELTQMHDPFLMRDMDVAVERILEAQRAGQKIMLLGDYDVDGTTAVTLLSLFLSNWGVAYEYYIPDRYKEGYGVSYQGIDYADQIGAALIISLDCGIKAVDKVRYAREKDIDFIVCDHHKPGAELPEAIAILDPQRPDCAYPDKNLAGCGVGLKLIQAIMQALSEKGESFPQADFDPLQQYCDLVTLSIACDIVPIIGENRVIAYQGLNKLKSNPMPGIKALMDQAGDTREWDISDLVFFVGPRINSAGRLGHASSAVEVLMGKSLELTDLAADLQTSNIARQDIDRLMTEEALSMIASDETFPQKSTTVLYQPGWHKGVIGIVASRLIEHHYRPTIMLTESEGKLVGSARSVVGFDLYEALDQCNGHLLQFGGHRYAAGLSMKPEQLVPFQQQFDAVVAQSLTPEQRSPVLYIDHILRFPEIDARFIRLINRMGPFGPSNRRPVFISRKVEVRFATFLKETHVKFVFEQEGVLIEAIGFNLGATWRELGETGPLDITYQPIFNTWNKKTQINLRLKDIKPYHEENLIQ